jgi:hypothetical protein
MAYKLGLFRAAARETIPHGATLPCDAGRVSLGPQSKSLRIRKSWGPPIDRPTRRR